jgi:PAS domain S-box-containing protein
MPPDPARPTFNSSRFAALVGGLCLFGLFASSGYSYLLFHTLVELFTILIAFLVFALVWNTRRMLDNQYLLFLGISFLFSGALVLAHTLAYQGMDFFPGDDTDLSTQMWIAFRYVFSISFLLAPFFINRKVNISRVFAAYGSVTVVLAGTIFWGIFPSCYRDGLGMTPFKIFSEYAVSAILMAALGLLILKRGAFDRGIFFLLSGSVAASVFSALSYTQHVTVIGAATMAGHFFELIANYLIYRAVVVAGLVEPTSILFRNLKESEARIRDSEERYRSLVELSPDAIVVHSEGIYRYVNPAGVTLFGAASANELINRKVLDLTPQGLREAAALRIRGIQEGVVPPPMESQILRIDGRSVDIESTETSALYEGRPAVRAFIRDITARKQAEAALRKANEGLEARVQERTAALKSALDTLQGEIRDRIGREQELRRVYEMLRNTLESISEGFFTLDREWRFTYLNNRAQKFFQRSAARLLDASIWEASPDTVTTVFETHCRRAVEEQVPVVFEAVAPSTGAWVEVKAYPSPDGLTVYINDISERKEAERRDAFTNALLNQFIKKFNRREYLDSAVELLRDWSGCSSVGVRVIDGSGNIPYASCLGFSPGFLESENALSVRRDACACTRIITGATEPQDLPAMTRAGSFYANNSMQFLESLTGEQRTRFRGVCARSGFTSLAVVPVRHGDTVIGAIHLADEREGMVPRKNIEFIEQMAFIIGEAIYRFGIEEELRRNYEALRESEKRYRSLVEDIRDVIFTLKPDGAISSLSPAFEDITGWPRERWLGRPFTELLHPGEAPAAIELFPRILNNKPLPLFELQVRIRSGGCRYFEFKITSGRTAENMILGIARDITERKRADEDHARLVSALESTAEAVVITDPVSGLIQYVNPAFETITGFPRKEALGHTLHYLESGTDDADYFNALKETLRLSGVWRGPLISKKKGGAPYFEERTVSPVKNSSGDIINYVYVLRDVSERVRLESIAESVNTMDNIGFVFSGVRHEIGNPVNSINMILGILRNKLEVLPTEAVREYLVRMAEQVGRVEYMLRSLKSFNLYETQQPHPFQAASFFENFLPLIRSDFETKGITIEIKNGPANLRIYADPRALQQSLLNVLTNAADALSGCRDPKITLSVQSSGGMIVIRIEDNGCGIPEDKLQSIFKPFFTTKPEGTGLGLVIVKKMLANMNGTIDIESRKDEGTRVTIALPEGRDAKN